MGFDQGDAKDVGGFDGEPFDGVLVARVGPANVRADDVGVWRGPDDVLRKAGFVVAGERDEEEGEDEEYCDGEVPHGDIVSGRLDGVVILR